MKIFSRKKNEIVEASHALAEASKVSNTNSEKGIVLAKTVLLLVAVFVSIYAMALVTYWKNEDNSFADKCAAAGGVTKYTGHALPICLKTEAVIEVK